MRFSLKAKTLTPTPFVDGFERGEVEPNVECKPFQPSARDFAGSEVIAMNHGSIRRVAGNGSPEAYFSLYGEFDILNRDQLSAALEESVGYRTITIDLVHTTFIDASILGVLVRLAGRCRNHNTAQVRIVNANTHLRRLFSICGLEGIFDFASRRAHTVIRAAQ